MSKEKMSTLQWYDGNSGTKVVNHLPEREEYQMGRTGRNTSQDESDDELRFLTPTPLPIMLKQKWRSSQ